MRSLKLQPSRVLVLLAASALAGISAQASEDNFVVAVGPRNELLTGAGSGYNAGQWYSYPTGWHSQWFNNAPFDPGRKNVIGLRLSVEPLDSALPCRIIITYGWSTPQWSALGRDTPPLPGAAPESTYIQRHVAFQGYLPAGAKPIPVADTYEIRQYNPQWLSVDVQGENFVITDGRIKHESMPRTAGDITLLQQQTEACCFKDGTCADLTPSACQAGKGVPQGPGTNCKTVVCQQPVQCAPRADEQGCLNVTCPTTSDICVPTKIRVDRKITPPKYTVLSCACLSPNLCHLAIDPPANVYCVGGCPAGQQCQMWATYNLDGTIDYECRCGAQPTEACCIDGRCIDTTPDDCRKRNGEPQGPGTKCLGDANNNGIDDACEEPTPETVACCLPNGQCVNLKPDQCMGHGGTPLAPGSQCDTPQACCLPDGTCIMADPQCCRKAGGTPQGPNTDCKNVNCPQPLEACCLPDGTCTDTTANDCRAKGGTPQGPGTNCNTVVCPQPTEACCLPDGTCQNLTPAQCAEKGGIPQGAGTDCSTVNCLPPGGCEWNTGDPHKMHFPQLPDLQGWDVEVPPTDVADDWKCSETGPVTDIHFWYSWQGDKVGIIDRIHASIYSNIPAGDSAYGYSVPGHILWERVFGPDELNLRHWATGNQGFMNWRINLQGWIMGYHTWRPNDHKDIYQCNICNITDPFTQQAGQIYWLVLSITIRDPVGTHIGWKTSLDHFEDDAVYWGAPTGIWHWRELRDPQTEKSLDLAFVITGEEVPECDWNAGDPHKMHWPQPPDLSDKGVDVDMFWATLADDFKCTATSPITDIHFWGSFADDILPAGGPGSLAFKIAIHADIPATTAKPWSTPGEVLWSRTSGPGEYTVRQVHEGPEGWYDPATKLYQPNNHKKAYQYNFCIDIEPFVQQEGKVYWLAIKDIAPASAGYTFGWKTTTRKLRWNDDAVYLHRAGLGWLPMTYPDGHAYKGETLDLAFVITGGEEAKAEHDLGDAPDSSNTFGVPMTAYPKGGPLGVRANYPTVYRAGSPPHGPIHLQPRAVAYLGDAVSLENEADVGPDEDGINNLVPPNDNPDLDKADDGVKMPLALPHCQETRFKYKVKVVPLAAIEPPDLYVNVWFDWNRDGDWNDTMQCPTGVMVPEWAVQNQLLQFVASGTYDITTPAFTCWHPAGVTKENPIWMRITLSERQWGMVTSAARAGGDGPAAGYEFGETEDYYFVPELPGPPQYDFGDAPDPKYPTLLASNGARHRIGGPWLDAAGKPDAEPDGQPDPRALGDDNNGLDDEDGVEIPPLIQGHTAALTLHVNGGGGSVQAWIDFDGDGIWRISERVYNGVLPNGTHIINVPVPADAAVDGTFARFRISSAGGLGPAGEAADGEVEDYLVEIKAPPPDIEWPQWPDLTRNGINIRVDTSDGKLRTLADDFKCTTYKKITDVHLWGSWKYDRKGVIKRIHLSIHAGACRVVGGSDTQNRFSQPDQQVLWAKDFGPGQFTETLYHKLPTSGEWWWDPVTGELIRGGDREVWQIDIYISSADAFQQKGSPDSPLIYWLDVQVDTENGQFGWKTRQWPEHYMDDAVWDVGRELPRLWKELRYPQGHPYYGLEKDSIDMAFVITGREEAPPPPPTAEHTKWSQPPIEIDPKAKTPFYCGWDEPSFAIRPSSTTAVLPTVWQIVADDFRCLGNMPVTSVHWWGSYQGWDSAEPPAVRPTAWRIGFWSNVPANPLAKPGHSYPRKLLWRVDVPAQRVQEERAGYDRFPNRRSDTCFRYYVKFEPQEYFWQQKYIDSATADDVFWISITAIYPPVTIPFQQWGWKTRPQHWMDDAVKFVVEGDLPLGYVNDSPLIFTPIEAALCGQQASFDMAFELDTDPSYIKWEQAFTGIRDWTHYQDEQSTAMEGTQSTPIIRRLVADDWPCEQITPITAAVWWGSYIGYRYKACDCPLMAAPLKPDYFLLSIWTDVRPAANAPFSHPGEKIWEYKAKNYDEVFVGYDKQPETVQPGQAPGYEPVFRYSVRLPRDKWFCQKELNSIYWFSVVAVYPGDKTPLHPWGWTNHPRVDWQVSDPTVPPNIAKNDDAVAGYLDTTGATAVWKWQELHDQTGVSEDMSFMLFTEPGCFPCTYLTYNDWLTLGKPDCWCEPPYGSGYQCDGDADGKDSGGLTKFRVFTGDLSLIVANWKKKAGDPALDPCADIDHKDSGGLTKYRVFTGDLARLVANWKKKDAQLPGDCPRPE